MERADLLNDQFSEVFAGREFLDFLPGYDDHSNGVERQDVLVEHALEQPDRAGLVLKDRKVAAIAADDTKAELLVELT